MLNLLVREVKAHNDIITSIKSVKLEDLHGITTSSKDMKVQNWSLGLDLMCSFNLKHEHLDQKWSFKTKQKIKVTKEKI